MLAEFCSSNNADESMKPFELDTTDPNQGQPTNTLPPICGIGQEEQFITKEELEAYKASAKAKKKKKTPLPGTRLLKQLNKIRTRIGKDNST